MPDYRTAFLMGGDSSNNGTSIPAGLPNISGSFSGVGQEYGNSGATLSGAFYRINTTNEPKEGVKIANTSESKKDDYFGFDASLSNPIYGNSDTVHPPAICVNYCIQVKNSSGGSGSTGSDCTCPDKDEIKGWIDEEIKNFDFVIDWGNDEAGNWWRKYQSGWVEQGGEVAPANYANKDTVTVNLPITMQNTSYHVSATVKSIEADASLVWMVEKQTLTTVVFKADVMWTQESNQEANARGLIWKVSGYSADNDDNENNETNENE